MKAYLCPKHKTLLVPQGYYLMVCEVPGCSYAENHEGGNPGFYGCSQDYLYEHAKKLYSYRKLHNRQKDKEVSE